MSKSKLVDDGNVLEAIRDITEKVSGVVQSTRVSVWLLNQEKTLIECIDLFQKLEKTHSDGISIFAEDFPIFFKYLLEERVIVSNNALEDEARSEFKEVYLIPNKISSTLDAPIRVAGEMVGVLTIEHVGEPRQWGIEEVYFLGVVSDIISRLLEAEKRKDAIEKSELVKHNLEKLVMSRTNELNNLKTHNEILDTKVYGNLYLTTIVLSPLGSNRNRSSKVVTEFLSRQSNKFNFRDQDLEIGGGYKCKWKFILWKL